MTKLQKMDKSLLSLFCITCYVSLQLAISTMNQIKAVASPTMNQTRLIEKVCSETLEPSQCFECITSDPTRDFDDTPEFIHSLLFCMYSEATHAHVNADLISENATIPSLKSSLSECSRLLFRAANLAVDGMMSIESKKYFQAWNYSKIARRCVFRCANVFRENDNFTIPSSVLGHMIHAKLLYDSAHVLFGLIVD